jgi:hypothetical protein
VSTPTRSERIENVRLEVDAATIKLRDAVHVVEMKQQLLDEMSAPYRAALAAALAEEKRAKADLELAFQRLAVAAK